MLRLKISGVNAKDADLEFASDDHSVVKGGFGFYLATGTAMKNEKPKDSDKPKDPEKPKDSDKPKDSEKPKEPVKPLLKLVTEIQTGVFLATEEVRSGKNDEHR